MAGSENRPSWASRPMTDDRGAPPRSPAIWCGVKKLPEHAHSDLILNFRVPDGNDMGMPAGDYVAFLEWKEDWNKYTGMLKADMHKRPDPQKGGKEWQEQQKKKSDDIPF